MRVEQAQAKRGLKGGLMGAVMGLVFVAGFFLTLVAPTQLDKSLIDVGKPETAEITSIAPDGTSPSVLIAESNSLDLQLD